MPRWRLRGDSPQVGDRSAKAESAALGWKKRLELVLKPGEHAFGALATKVDHGEHIAVSHEVLGELVSGKLDVVAVGLPLDKLKAVLGGVGFRKWLVVARRAGEAGPVDVAR